MVAVVTRREPEVSPHILFEIAMCLQSRKPLLVFVEDALPGQLIPTRIFQRRFSRRSYIRQVREHRHALRILKTFLGSDPVPPYQPPFTQRSCITVGLNPALTPAVAGALSEHLQVRGYEVRDLSSTLPSSIQSPGLYDYLQSASLAVTCIDRPESSAAYLVGAVMAYFVPSIEFTTDGSLRVDPPVPEEYQPRFISNRPDVAVTTLENELNLFEEDFLDLDEQAQVRRYREELLALGSSGSYGHGTRSHIVQEVVMGDQYRIEGQAAVVGPGGTAVGNEFVQLWNRTGPDNIDLNALMMELEQLRLALRTVATKPEHDIAVAEVAAAQLAAEKNDGPRVLHHLRSAGRWALDTANKIGAGVATAALKTALGL